MKIVSTLIFLISSICARGVKNPTETSSVMNGMVMDIDWSGLMNQIQPAPQQMPVQQAPAPVPRPAPMPEYGVMVDAPMQPAPVQATIVQEVAPVEQHMPVVEAVAEFTEVSSGQQVQIPNVNTVADLIVRSWANTWSMMAQDPNSSITLIYAGYKPLEGVDGVHWRLVFKLSGSGNVEFIALDVAVLNNGMVDIFRNIQTRNLTDISVLFGINISANSSISMEYLKESFLHNSPMILNPNYNAAQANTSGFDINWTRVEITHVQEEPNLNVVLNNIGGAKEPEYGVMESSVDIGAGSDGDDFDMFGR